MEEERIDNRDQGDTSQDMLVLDEMDLDVLDFESLKRYRNRMAHQKPGHVWEELDESTRWTDRIVSTSGEWSGNIFDFYFKVYNRIAQDIKTPFKIENGTDRIDDTPVHKALREALANALIHACYYDRMGIVIKKMQDEIVIENPGTLRISRESALLGGNSDPRNATIIKMFNLINVGERSGSGVPNIFKVWKKENFCNPELWECFNPDRTTLLLPLEKVGAKSESKTEVQLQQILEYLSQNEECTRSDIELLLSVRSSRAGKLLKILGEEGKILRYGTGRKYGYRLKK